MELFSPVTRGFPCSGKKINYTYRKVICDGHNTPLSPSRFVMEVPTRSQKAAQHPKHSLGMQAGIQHPTHTDQIWLCHQFYLIKFLLSLIHFHSPSPFIIGLRPQQAGTEPKPFEAACGRWTASKQIFV